MLGYLLVNSNFSSEKFLHLYELLISSFKEEGIELEIKKARDFFDLKSLKRPDFVLFWDKDIYLGMRLEEAHIRLFNPIQSILAADNKALTYLALEKAGIRIPKTLYGPKTFEGMGHLDYSILEEGERLFGYPMVIKEVYGSFGQQVYLAKDYEGAVNIIKGLGYKEYIVQEFIASSFGKDVRVNIVGEEEVVSMIRHSENDFRSNISSGGHGEKYEPSIEMKNLACRASNALGLDFAGVDILFGEDGEPIVCEVNSNPQFASTLEATGVNLGEYIAKYIKKALKG